MRLRRWYTAGLYLYLMAEGLRMLREVALSSAAKSASCARLSSAPREEIVLLPCCASCVRAMTPASRSALFSSPRRRSVVCPRRHSAKAVPPPSPMWLRPSSSLSSEVVVMRARARAVAPSSPTAFMLRSSDVSSWWPPTAAAIAWAPRSAMRLQRRLSTRMERALRSIEATTMHPASAMHVSYKRTEVTLTLTTLSASLASSGSASKGVTMAPPCPTALSRVEAAMPLPTGREARLTHVSLLLDMRMSSSSGTHFCSPAF
mmetsp:Transcript_11809/g.30644  ORF Transcript_11809/g.30644 Transcript_11809/m.30644 type:complete len:261 (-) Transcript_11809:56-838(-)